MYYNFWRRNQIIFGIIIGAVIIGGFIYFAIKNAEIVVAPKIQNAAIITKKPATISPSASLGGCGALNNTIATKVIDGDTIVVEGGWHVRLLGMDADETGYPCYLPAKTRLENLILGKQIILQKDVSDVDQYGRCLRYVFLGNANIDAQLVQEGLAVARFYAPDVKYRTEITAAESQAIAGKIGCKWSGASQTVK